MNGDELGQLRTEIDSLDEELIKILALRFIATSKVGIIKAAKSLRPPCRPLSRGHTSTKIFRSSCTVRG